ncbi:hypothetical protein ACJRO7_031647 [Eucalyptus globulus]|uniref:Uncharacterized protein n=1 Tax=Eucalyptus globulus TaxID=34317 RepID=A0ABD3JFE4_EUCGL
MSPRKHQRCLADVNNLLGFSAITVALGFNHSSNLCVLERGCVCSIVQHWISVKKELKGQIGVSTTSTSGHSQELGDSETMVKSYEPKQPWPWLRSRRHGSHGCE